MMLLPSQGSHVEEQLFVQLILTSQVWETPCSPNSHCNMRQSEKTRGQVPCLSPRSPAACCGALSVGYCLWGSQQQLSQGPTHLCITCCSGKLHPHHSSKVPQFKGRGFLLKCYFFTAPEMLTLQQEDRCFQCFPTKNELGSMG